MLICGVDDAGRGSVLGPLVIAGVSIQKNNIKYLSEMGVRDSKELTPKSRDKLYKELLSVVENFYVVRISPQIIDRSVHKNKLNHLEAQYMARVIKKLEPELSYVDSCDVNPKRFGTYISRFFPVGKIHSSHHADKKYPVVSAASIIAKVTRDKAIEKLRQFHDLGSGYPSDSKTMEFIKKWVSENRTTPAFVRKSWKPVKLLLGDT